LDVKSFLELFCCDAQIGEVKPWRCKLPQVFNLYAACKKAPRLHGDGFTGRSDGCAGDWQTTANHRSIQGLSAFADITFLLRK